MFSAAPPAAESFLSKTKAGDHDTFLSDLEGKASRDRVLKIFRLRLAQFQNYPVVPDPALSHQFTKKEEGLGYS